MEQYLQVGIITSTHGIAGEVKVFPTTDDLKRFKKLKEVLVDTGKERLPLTVDGVKFFKQFAILKFKGIDSINDVQKYKGMPLFVTREHAVRLSRGEYFIADLIGMRVVSEDASFEGTLSDVMQTGANDVYVIRQKDTEKELLLPAIKDCVLSVDMEQNRMTIHLLDGLLEM